MIPENRISTHPGEVLREEFLEPMGIPQRVSYRELARNSAKRQTACHETNHAESNVGFA